MPSEHVYDAPGDTEQVEENVTMVSEVNTEQTNVESVSWNEWASQNQQVLWGVAAGTAAVVLGFAIRSFNRRA